MAKRKIKSNKGVYKEELQNEPLKFLVNSHEQNKLVSQVSNRSQSSYLRYLLLDAPPRRVVEPEQSYTLTEAINELGQKLNAVAKNVNQALLRDETINIATNETIFVDIYQSLEYLATKVVQIKTQKESIRDIQIKFLVTPSQLKAAEARLKVKNLSLSRYMRQQITGYREVKCKNKAEEVIRAVSKLSNNVNQIVSVIKIEEKAHRLVIVSPETRFEISTLQQNINSLQRLFIGDES